MHQNVGTLSLQNLFIIISHSGFDFIYYFIHFNIYLIVALFICSFLDDIVATYGAIIQTCRGVILADKLSNYPFNIYISQR